MGFISKNPRYFDRNLRNFNYNFIDINRAKIFENLKISTEIVVILKIIFEIKSEDFHPIRGRGGYCITGGMKHPNGQGPLAGSCIQHSFKVNLQYFRSLYHKSRGPKFPPHPYCITEEDEISVMLEAHRLVPRHSLV